MQMSSDKSKQSVQTTGHAWDGDLQEFNNPLPTWWLWGFYATVVFALIYWVLYPAWPVGDSYTKGIGNQVTYTTKDGKTVTTHWNTRALYEQEMQQARAKQAVFLDQLKDASYQEILNDPKKRGFALSFAKVLFADNCAACHQAGGAGIVGEYPNLADDSWLWGGSFQQIQTTISEGRHGNMPSFAGRLKPAQFDEISEYVLSLSGQAQDPAKAALGKKLFEGEAGCFACHTKAGTGNVLMGSANLTDHIWTIANIRPGMSHEQKQKAIIQVVSHGVSRTMPTWKHRFNATEVKMLAFYVHELGGGK
jgi:cytochrome c oxidase cbb3-type subunit 3